MQAAIKSKLIQNAANVCLISIWAVVQIVPEHPFYIHVYITVFLPLWKAE